MTCHYLIFNAEHKQWDFANQYWHQASDIFPQLPVFPETSLIDLLGLIEESVDRVLSLNPRFADRSIEERWGFDDINEDTGGLDLELEDGTMLSVYFLVIENPRPLNKKDMR